MMIAVAAVWMTSTGPPPSMIAALIARPTTSATCHAPVPMNATSASPTATPNATPRMSSITRLIRWVCAMATVITATTGAKTMPRPAEMLLMVNQVRPAAAEACTTSGAVAHSAWDLDRRVSRPFRQRCPNDSRIRLALARA